MYDLLIKNGSIVDGTGKAAYTADIAVSDGKIAAIGYFPDTAAQTVLDITGKTVTPGFIDIHRHADAAVFRPGFGQLELSQGLTTIINGNCGLSIAPFSNVHAQEIRSYLRPITGFIPEDFPSNSMKQYLDAIPATPIHTGMLVGAGILRADVAGYQTEHLMDHHYSQIHHALEQALADGALGVSLGMGYSPECFYTTDELCRVLAPLSHQDIPITVHMRQEGPGVCDSIKEMIDVARRLDCPVHISHLKAMGKEYWQQRIPEALTLIEKARMDGLHIDCDVYPYTAGSTQLIHILPPDFLAGGLDHLTTILADRTVRRELDARIKSGVGFDDIARLAGWEGIYLTSLRKEENKCYQGKNLVEIGTMMGKTPLDACCDLLVSEHCQITMIDFVACEEDILSILKKPFSHLISDATYPTEGQPHPRVYGTFIHMLEHFVKNKSCFTLEEAVTKMTSLPAQTLHLRTKGIIAPGMDADLNVFELNNLHECGTYDDPCHDAAGIDYVFVSGKLALDHGHMTSTSAGKILRRTNNA